MKIVNIKTQKPSFLTSDSEIRNLKSHGRNDEPIWQYQGKRRDQVESSYKIFAFSILAALTLALFALLFGL
jgi:hypothetical protein